MPQQFKLIGTAILLALLALGQWYWLHSEYRAGQEDVQVKWDADQIKQAEAQKAVLLAYADKLKHAETQHDKDQLTIAQLADDARRVRIHLPACPGVAQTGAGADGGAGVFQQGVDESFARFQERVGGLVTRCDQLNIDAIRANGSR